MDSARKEMAIDGGEIKLPPKPLLIPSDLHRNRRKCRNDFDKILKQIYFLLTNYIFVPNTQVLNYCVLVCYLTSFTEMTKVEKE